MSLVRERERRRHGERLVSPARGGVHLDLRRRRAHGGGERELPRHGRRELAARPEPEPPAPRLGHDEVDAPRAAADQHQLEVGQLGGAAQVAQHELARHLDLARQLARDGDGRAEHRLELRRPLEEPEHHAASRRSRPRARQRVISSRQRRKTSSSCIEGSAMSPDSPASSRTVSTGLPAASGKSRSIWRCCSVITRMTSAAASRWRWRFRSVARAHLDPAREAVLGEQPLEHLLRDDAAARVGVADDEDAPPWRGRSAHSPPAKTSPNVSGAVIPFASSSLMRAPSFIGSQGAGSGFLMRVAECQPFIGHTLRPPTRNTWLFTLAASSLASQATSGATFAGLNMSNSPGFGSAPMRAAVEGVASTVSRVRATGAIALAVTPYFFISWPMMIAMAATAALHAP